jgi:uncharacterized damage-inducible protein DinB
MPQEDPLVETWMIHNRINLYLLDAIPEEALGAALPKCKSVFDQFGHIHNVRLLWFKASAPELLEGLMKFEPNTLGTKDQLRSALIASGAAVESLVRKAIANGGGGGGKVKGFKPHVTAFLGYLISHESHHRGQIGWTLKQSGHPLDRKTALGLWEWGVR